VSQPPGTYAYTLTCQDSAGSTAQTATLNVTPGLSVTIGGNTGLSTAQAMLGQGTTVAWSANAATTCAFGGAWSGTAPVTSTQSVSPTDIGEYTFALTCSAAGQRITQSVTLIVTPALNISVSPSTIPAGQSATLTWTSTGAASCTAEEGWTGTQTINGTASISPPTPGTYLYSLACPDAQGDYSYASTFLTVTANSFAQTRLVADSTSTPTRTTDSNLVNPWGIAFVDSMAFSGGPVRGHRERAERYLDVV
jgi:hypothetical protein